MDNRNGFERIQFPANVFYYEKNDIRCLVFIFKIS